MKKNDMLFKIKESFDERTPDVLSKIKNSHKFKIPQKTKKSLSDYISVKSFSYSLATIFILALLITTVIMSGPSTPVVASTITLDINPSIEITLDEDDFVINITGLNDEGETLISRDIKYRGLTLDRAIEIIIEKANERGYIIEMGEENVILIKVDTNSEEARVRIEELLQTKIANEVNKYGQLVRVIKERNPNVTDEQIGLLIDIARTNKISVAKLLVIRRIIILDDTKTLEELKDVSVRELYRIEYRLLNPLEEEDTPGNRENSPGNGN